MDNKMKEQYALTTAVSLAMECIGCEIVDVSGHDIVNIKFSIPEFSSLSELALRKIYKNGSYDDLCKLNTIDGKIEEFKETMISLWTLELEDDLITKDDCKEFTKFLCKVRKGETWTDDDMNSVIDKYKELAEKAQTEQNEFKEV